MEPVPPPLPVASSGAGPVWGVRREAWPQEGEGQGQSGREREQAGSELAKACARLPVSGPLLEGRGRGETASALDPVCHPMSQLPGASPQPVPRGFPTEDPAGPSPGPTRSPGLQRVCQEGEQRALFTGVGRPCQKPGLNPRTWEAVGTPAGWGTGRVRKPAPSLQSFPPGTHTSVWQSEVATCGVRR